MSTDIRERVRRKLIELLESESGVQGMFIVSGATGFKSEMIIEGEKRRMSLGAGNFAVLVLDPAQLAGLPNGIYDPEVEAEEETQ